MTDGGGEPPAGRAPRKRKARARDATSKERPAEAAAKTPAAKTPAAKTPAAKTAPATAAPLPADLRPSRVMVPSGAALFTPTVPAVALFALTFVPRIADHASLALQLRVAAALLFLLNVLVALRVPRDPEHALRPRIEVVIRKPHWVQLLTQSGVYVYWGYYHEPVRRYVPLLIAQVFFVYAFDALVSWWRRRPWVLGFAPIPIIWSTNLFLWFKDDWFAVQLGMVALGVLSKEIRWNRGGASRHVFNPSSIALALVSAVLLLTGTTDATHGYEIALSQDRPPHIHLALFLLGLVVQLNFPVVLVTMSAAISITLAGAAYTAATGVYMFTTTSIPAAVLLGSLLLVTDPATSPERRVGKVMFGASYGLMVFALYPLLESYGPYGYFDKLLPVPILNLLVPRFDALSDRLTPRLVAAWDRMRGAALAWATSPRAGNFLHVAIWIGSFVALYATRAVGAEHEGKSVEFWVHACEAKQSGACNRLYAMWDNACARGVMEACHNLGGVLADGKASGTRTSVDDALGKACDSGIAASCARLADRYRNGEGIPPDPVRAAALYDRACEGGDGVSCHNLGDAYRSGRGVPQNAQLASALFKKACDKDIVQGCSSYAAMEMNRGGPNVNRSAAAQAFSKACDGGDATGCANLAAAFALGNGVPVDMTRSAEYDQRACDGKVAVACARLADNVRAGRGVLPDDARADRLQQRACQLGYAPACQRR